MVYHMIFVIVLLRYRNVGRSNILGIPDKFSILTQNTKLESWSTSWKELIIIVISHVCLPYFHSVSNSSSVAVCQQYQTPTRNKKKSLSMHWYHQNQWEIFFSAHFWLGSYFLRENAPSNGSLIETWTNYQNHAPQ